LLLSRRHWPWWILFGTGAVVSLVSYVLFARTATPEGPFGGTTAGLWFGIAAGLGMLAAAFLAVRKKYIVSPLIPGSARLWLHVHLWIGTLALLWTFLHSGFRFGGPFERILMGVWLFVAASGFFGLLVQQYVPRLMTDTIRAETFAQQVPILCRRLLVRADWLTAHAASSALSVRQDVADADVEAVYEELKAAFKEAPERDAFKTRSIKKVEDFKEFVYRTEGRAPAAPVLSTLAGPNDPGDSGSVVANVAARARAAREFRESLVSIEFDPMAERLRTFYQDVVRPYLRLERSQSVLNAKSTADVQFDSLRSPLPPRLEAAAAEIENICDTRRQYVAQRRLLWWLHSWLYLHVPASMVLLVLFLLHVFLALRVVPPG
jgi:hypothetical protein